MTKVNGILSFICQNCDMQAVGEGLCVHKRIQTEPTVFCDFHAHCTLEVVTIRVFPASPLPTWTYWPSNMDLLALSKEEAPYQVLPGACPLCFLHRYH